jgi:hypothetical protein
MKRLQSFPCDPEANRTSRIVNGPDSTLLVNASAALEQHRDLAWVAVNQKTIERKVA